MCTTSCATGGNSPSSSVPSRWRRTMWSVVRLVNAPAAVNRISSRPGMRRLMLPCPDIESVPLRTMALAVSTTCLFRAIISVVMSVLPISHQVGLLHLKRLQQVQCDVGDDALLFVALGHEIGIFM